ncbi:Protein of unknown function [Pyronema omphalodes CBS 100304]|uniref:Uncharacterized protein n=1 Tax=Pyronema omphalodes (strain CBS 100304) TaxID=1076935 RepID=U4LHF2_PYROM|nr:Protein of unknown function [Pyronema omphalodes CBS 100304]
MLELSFTFVPLYRMAPLFMYIFRDYSLVLAICAVMVSNMDWGVRKMFWMRFVVDCMRF